MKVIFVDHFTIPGLRNPKDYVVFFIEGIKNHMILYYNDETREFMLQPVSYYGKNKENLEEQVKTRVSLINKLKIKLEALSTATIINFQLGKARFISTYFEDGESEFYVEQAKKALLKVNDRHSDNTKARIYGYAEFSDDIWEFAYNLKEIDVQKLNNQPNQLEIPKECYTEL